MIEWDLIEPWEYIITSVAAEYHRKYDMVELTDIKQSLYEWFAAHPKKLEHWNSIGEKDAKNLLYRSLRNQALDYCQLWKSLTLGYETSDLYYYDMDMVEVLLPNAVRGDLEMTQQVDLGRSGKAPTPAEGGNMMTMLIEINIAYWKLDKKDSTILFYRYINLDEFQVIANKMELSSPAAARMAAKRALKRLVAKMGGHRPKVEKDIVEVDQSVSIESSSSNTSDS